MGSLYLLVVVYGLLLSVRSERTTERQWKTVTVDEKDFIGHKQAATR